MYKLLAEKRESLDCWTCNDAGIEIWHCMGLGYMWAQCGEMESGGGVLRSKATVEVRVGGHEDSGTNCRRPGAMHELGTIMNRWREKLLWT